MPLRWIPLLMASLLAAGPVAARADLVVPTAAVDTRVNVRARPMVDSEVVGKLDGSGVATWVSDMPGWHKIRMADGTEGYVSSEWVDRRVQGPLFSVHVADVGTGLAVLVRGRDFALVYDAGSNDDDARGDYNRFVALLESAAPDLRTIDYVVVSHPHKGHVELLPDVLARYEVRAVLDPGVVNPICGYHRLLEMISEEDGIDYRSAHRDVGEHDVNFGTYRSCYGKELPKEVTLEHGPKLTEKRTIALGEDASMRILYTDGSRGQSFDDNSLVVRLDLAGARILLMGDAGGGRRDDPRVPPSPKSIEGKLLAWNNDEVSADVLVVGNHGSSSGSRVEFLDAVDADIFVVSAGPSPYGDVVLPERAVVDELRSRGVVFRTDFTDATCGVDPSKIGPDADGKPGGCDNVLIEVMADSAVKADYWRHAD